MKTGAQGRPDAPSLMLVGEPPHDNSWKYEKTAGGHRYTSAAGLWSSSWRTLAHRVPRRAGAAAHQDQSHRGLPDVARPGPAVFLHPPALRLFPQRGGGLFALTRREVIRLRRVFHAARQARPEVVLWANDANGVETGRMYKPIPFFMSSRGYGMFVHTSAPATFDFGAAYGFSNALMLGDDELDLFVFLGEPKDILNEYTNLTGKAAMPPLWSFGLWMSRITYFSEDEVRGWPPSCARTGVPADVIHLDTGWFETDWRCDYKFSTTRFKDPREDDRRSEAGWLSYFALAASVLPFRRIRSFPEILAKGLAVRDGKGNLPMRMPYSISPIRRPSPGTRKDRGPAAHGSGGHQSGFRRGGSADGSLCQRPQRVSTSITSTRFATTRP